MSLRKFSIGEIAGAIFVALLFIISAYMSTKYVEKIHTFMGIHQELGVSVYIFFAMFATVIAPVSATPLIPIASSLWGPFFAGVYSIVGWTLGAVIAFYLTRTYGHAFVGKFVKLRKVQEHAERMPRKTLFWSVVFMRMVVPVDVLSYALGLFSDMKLSKYTIATVIGITPFAFVFSYAVHLSLWLQILLFILVGLFVIIGYTEMKKNFHNNDKGNMLNDGKHIRGE